MSTNKKRVIFFDFVTNYGGAQHSLVLLSEKLKNLYDMYVIDAFGCCRNYLDDLEKREIPLIVLMAEARTTYIGYSNKPLRRIWAFFKQLPAFWILRRRLFKNINDISPDLICTTSHKALFFLSSFFGFRKYPVAIFAFGWYKKSVLSVIARWLIRNRTDGVLAISNPTKEALKSWGVRENKIHVVYDVVELNLKSEKVSSSKDDLPAVSSGFKVLIPASLLRTKGQHTAIKAAALLNGEGIDFVMWLAGGMGAAGKSDYSNYLERLITENKLEKKVFVLGWRNDVPALMSLSDAVLLPTFTEGIPRAVTEAMVLKRPVITTPVGGIPDFVINNETGLLFPVEDEKSLAECLKKLINDRDFAGRLAENAYRYIFEKLNPDKQLNLVVEAFEKVMTDNKANR